MTSLEDDQDDWLIHMMSCLDINATSTRNNRVKVEQAVTTDSLNVLVRSVRQPKVVRVTSGPKQPILDQNEDIKSQLAILLEILDEEYASYLIPKASFVDTNFETVKTNNDKRLDEVKFAIRAAYISGKSNESQVNDNVQIQSWTYEDELKEASYLISKWKFVFQGQCV